MSRVLDKATALPEILRWLKKMSPGECLQVLTWKRDRYLSINKKSAQVLFVQERGFSEQDFEVTPDKLRKLLKTLLRREFPRSNKIRTKVYVQNTKSVHDNSPGLDRTQGH